MCEYSSRRRPPFSALTSLFAKILAAMLCIPAIQFISIDTASGSDSVRSINAIIDAMKTPPPEAPPRAVSAPGTDCTRIMNEVRTGRVPTSEKERQVVRDCTSDAPRIDFAVPFEFDSARISPAALPQLQELGRALESSILREASFIVAGHTDRKGRRAYNQKLSQRRAEAVRNYLVENFSVRGRQLTAIGYGFEFLKVPSEPYAGVNRRVELIRTR